MIIEPDTTDDLLVALTHAVRFLSLGQVARGWFAGCEQQAVKAVEALASWGLVACEDRFVHPELPATSPVWSWDPGHEVPDFRPIAYELRKRWSNTREETTLVSASDEACRRFGGTRVVPRSSELSHDLHMGAVFLVSRVNRRTGLTWRSGDWLRAVGLGGEFGTSLPDAVLIGQNGAVCELVEGGGSYSVSKLGEIHRAYRHYPYTVW